MAFITKPHIVFSEIGRKMCYISSKSYWVSLGPPFRYSNSSCTFTTSSGIFHIISRPTISFNTMPVLYKNQHGSQYCTRLVGLFLLTLCRPIIMSRCLSFYFYPWHQCFSLESKILKLSSSSCELKRQKSSKKSQKRPEHDSDSDTDDEEPIQGTKVLTIHLQSLRTDGVLKKALGVARNKVEAAFYEGNIRVNGGKPLKKSHQLKIGDEVDLIRGVSPVNPDLLSISRVEILSVREDDANEQLSIKIRRTKTLNIENYNTDSWKKGNNE